MQNNPTEHYDILGRSLHWVIVLLVSIMLLLGYLMQDMSPAYKFWWYNLHKSIGITTLGLMLVRLGWRLTSKQPAPPRKHSFWERQLAKYIHGLFYIVLILMPLSGWLMSTASGHPPKYFWLFYWPLPLQTNHSLATIAHHTHALLAWTLIILIGLHTLAVLKHHLIDRDDTLRRMLPSLRRNNNPNIRWQKKQ